MSADGHSETLCVLQVVELAGGDTLPYDKICICSGATPKAVADHPAVLVLRDSDSVQALGRYVEQPVGSSAVHATSTGITICLCLALLSLPASGCTFHLPPNTAACFRPKRADAPEVCQAIWSGDLQDVPQRVTMAAHASA